jgi:hypothetical protein
MNGNYILNGKLQMTDDETGEFEIVTENGTVNVSSILDNIFDSGLRPQVYVKVMRGNVLIFEESGGLFYCRDKQGVDSYMICGMNLDKTLWDNTGECLEITIKRERKMKDLYGKS